MTLLDWCSENLSAYQVVGMSSEWSLRHSNHGLTLCVTLKKLLSDRLGKFCELEEHVTWHLWIGVHWSQWYSRLERNHREMANLCWVNDVRPLEAVLILNDDHTVCLFVLERSHLFLIANETSRRQNSRVGVRFTRMIWDFSGTRTCAERFTLEKISERVQRANLLVFWSTYSHFHVKTPYHPAFSSSAWLNVQKDFNEFCSCPQ